MRIGERSYNIRTGLSIFLTISVLSALAIFFLTADTGSWRDFRRISPGYAALAGLLMIAQWCLNALRFKILLNCLDNNVSFITSLKAFMSNVFMAAITPSQTGGGPMQIYVLNRSGVSVARAFAGCLMGAVLTVVSLLSTTLAILVFSPGFRLELGRHLAGVLLAAVIVCSLLASLFLLSLFRIDLVRRVVGRSLLAILRFLKTERRLAFTKRVLGGINQYRESIAMFGRVRKRRVALALFVTLACLATNSLIAPVLIHGLGVDQDLSATYLAQPILFFIAYFGPTPGASGIAEFSNYWLLTSLEIDPAMMGVYTVLWRIFTIFIGVAVGGLVVLSIIPRAERAA
ncbi:MAG: flippase-like domain-containing protein [bacterium]|jgi:hypothetical protein